MAFGVGWQKTSREGCDCISDKLDDPSFTAPSVPVPRRPTTANTRSSGAAEQLGRPASAGRPVRAAKASRQSFRTSSSPVVQAHPSPQRCGASGPSRS
ncbi:hypothetical protein [Sphingobium sp.]|uniref:hypothetical protein n=1 Tax=Sphingobium sp. TaxID=1912891 RepID=UPI00258106E7|nr:hypothetical protein [Sphingobium sp.]